MLTKCFWEVVLYAKCETPHLGLFVQSIVADSYKPPEYENIKPFEHFLATLATFILMMMMMSMTTMFNCVGL